MANQTGKMTRTAAALAATALIGAGIFTFAVPASNAASSNATPADQPAAAQSSSAMSQQDQVSYAIGYQIGQSFKSQNVDVDPQVVAQGIKAGMGKEAAKLNSAQRKQALVQFRKDMFKKAQAKRQAEGKINATKSKAFLEANSKKEGVQVTQSGLQYKILQKGTGTVPTAKDTVTVKYTGTLPDGTVFDASSRHGGTATFPVNGVIAGWTEALEMMHPGAKWRIWVPADLAYGTRGAGSQIGPNQALVFEVELVKVDKAKDAQK